MKKSKEELSTENSINETKLLNRLNSDIWVEIFSFLTYEDMIGLSLVAKSFHNLVNLILSQKHITLPIIRNEIEKYAQCKISFEKFPRPNDENKINYRSIFIALKNLANKNDKLYNASLASLVDQNIPEAEFIFIALYLIHHPTPFTQFSIPTGVQLAEKFYNTSPNSLTALILAHYLRILGYEYVVNHIKIENQSHDNSFFNKAVRQLLKDTKNSYKNGRIQLSYEYSELIRVLTYKAFENFGINKTYLQLPQDLQWQYITVFSHIRSYKLLLTILKHGLLDQIFSLTPEKYYKLFLDKTLWLFDLYKNETFNQLKKLEGFALEMFASLTQQKEIKEFMESNSLPFDLKYQFFNSLVSLNQDRLATSLKEVIRPQFLNITTMLEMLRKQYSIPDTVYLASFYFKYPFFAHLAPSNEWNEALLKTPMGFVNAICNILIKSGHATHINDFPKFLMLFKHATQSGDLIHTLKVLEFITLDDEYKQLKDVYEKFLQKPDTNFTCVDLNRNITVSNNSADINRNSHSFFVSRVKIKNLKRKQSETEIKKDESSKKLKTDESIQNQYTGP